MKIKLSPGAFAPVRANPTDAGLDLKACKEYKVEPQEVVLVDTGVSIMLTAPRGQMDSRGQDVVGLVFQRSGMIKSGMQLANCVGVIDADYRGTIKVAIRNMNHETAVNIMPGDRIAQLVITPITIPRLELYEGSEEDWEKSTSRGTDGFGSTGR